MIAMMDKNAIYNDLTEKGISYTAFDHEPVFTVEDAQKVDENFDGISIKNLFIYDKKKNMYLITVPHDIRPDLKKLRHRLETNGNFSFCNETRLWDNLGVKPGSVTPLAVVNDTNQNVTAVIDKSCGGDEFVLPHPLLNDATIQLTGTDLIKYMQTYNHDPIVIDFKAEGLLQDE